MADEKISKKEDLKEEELEEISGGRRMKLYFIDDTNPLFDNTENQPQNRPDEASRRGLL